MQHLTVINGAMAMDGGSVYLKTTDPTGRKHEILLDWSLSAQRTGATSLSINGVKLQPGSNEEARWIDALRGADIADALAPGSSNPEPQGGIVLAPDAERYLEAMAQGPKPALLTLRDDLLTKLQSPLHRREAGVGTVPTRGTPTRKGPLPLP